MRASSTCLGGLVVVLATNCGTPRPAPVPTPSDDPADYAVDPSVEYEPQVSDPVFVVPSRALPSEAKPLLAANNNLDLRFFQGRLYLAWRTAPDHFASTETRLHLVSSPDEGQSWRYETTVAMGTDLREPHFLDVGGVLRFHFFQAGVDRFSFEPKAMWRMARLPDAGWSEPETWGDRGEISWDLKVRNGVGYRTSYVGPHYVLGDADGGIELRFTQSQDGTQWSPGEAGAAGGAVYRGGVSEAGFEFDAEGNLWAVTRNEDGDSTGFGSQVCFAAKGQLGAWTCSARSDPERYDSPRMLRHGKDLYLLARRDVGGPFDQGRPGLTFAQAQLQYLAEYSTRPKHFALYRLDTQARKVVWLKDLPGQGDTAFAGIARLDAHRFLVANYTSPLNQPESITWLQGQVCDCGTKIYLTTLEFVPK
jgi:hypothetical protein